MNHPREHGTTWPRPSLHRFEPRHDDEECAPMNRDPRASRTVPFRWPFGEHVLGTLRQGGRVRRDAWPAEWWLVLVPGSVVRVEHGRPMGAALPDLVGLRVDYQPHLDLLKPPGTVEAWAPTHADVLARDWVAVPAWTGSAPVPGLPPADEDGATP